MKILHLTLKKKWYDMILSGEKKEEYREAKPYWLTRLLHIPHNYTHVKFRNGYRKESPWMIVEIRYFGRSIGKPEWGGGGSKQWIMIGLGDIVATSEMVETFVKDVYEAKNYLSEPIANNQPSDRDGHCYEL